MIGFEALALGMRALDGRLQAGMRECLAASAESAAEAARAIAPVETGALRGGIRISQSDGRTATVVSAAPYAAMVEFGTSRMRARAYMKPAAEAAREVFFTSARAAAAEAMREEL